MKIRVLHSGEEAATGGWGWGGQKTKALSVCERERVKQKCMFDCRTDIHNVRSWNDKEMVVMATAAFTSGVLMNT